MGKMGGNSAWKKRFVDGELMKGSGGAALRHHPRLGRRGKDLKLNRLGNIGGHGNPKRKKTKQQQRNDVIGTTVGSDESILEISNKHQFNRQSSSSSSWWWWWDVQRNSFDTWKRSSFTLLFVVLFAAILVWVFCFIKYL
jgi:hypothetical protein